MSTIIGQKRLTSLINSYTIHNIPRTILFLGETGCGKHLFANMIATKLGLDKKIIESSVTPDDLLDFTRSPLNTLYIINLSDFDLNQQNQLLKFIEEPSETSYIILMAESEINVLPTVLNRCFKYHFEPYSVEELKQFDWCAGITDELAYVICKTPGKLMEADAKSFEKAKNLGMALVEHIHETDYPNTLSIAKYQINCKSDFEKLDMNLFLDVLEYLAWSDYVSTKNPRSFTIYSETNKYRKLAQSKSLIKYAFMVNFLSNLWEVTR